MQHQQPVSIAQWLGALICGLAIATAFLDLHYYGLVWVGFVPLLLACHGCTLRQVYLLSLFAGFVTFASGTYWIISFIQLSKGLPAVPSVLIAVCIWLYCAHLFVMLMLGLHWLQRHSGIHTLVLFPVLLAALTSAYPMLFAMRLGESQVLFTIALQGSDLVGVHGVDAIIGLANALVFLMVRKLVTGSHLISLPSQPIMFGFAVVFLWFAYGAYSLNHWQSRSAAADSLSIGLVQANEQPTLNRSIRHAGYGFAYPPEMQLSQQLANAGAELVLWPEAQTKDVLNNGFVKRAYLNNVATMGIDLVLQDTHQFENSVQDQQYNSALLLRSTDKQTQQPGAELAAVYRKQRLIPMGERLPWFNKESLLGSKLSNFVGPFLNEIMPGTEHTLLTTDTLTMVPLICYETTFPRFVANAINKASSSPASAHTTQGKVIVGLSNDGWFGSSHQPFQHSLASTLRAVENRLPLIHVVNNGPSIVVAPSGEILFASEFQRAGAYLTNVPLLQLQTPSFFTRYPGLFTNSLYVLVLTFSIVGLWRKKRKK